MEARRKLATETPDTETGYWNARNMPSLARSSGVSCSRSCPLKVTFPPVTSYLGWPARTLARVLLPELLGSHEGVDLPLGYREIYSLQDLLAVDGGAEPLDDEGRLSRPRRT